jgi:hypothetical protein
MRADTAHRLARRGQSGGAQRKVREVPSQFTYVVVSAKPNRDAHSCRGSALSRLTTTYISIRARAALAGKPACGRAVAAHKGMAPALDGVAAQRCYESA